jgi:hypothetical protein
MSVTFVVSTGRSGSTMLSKILHQHRDILSVSEFFVTLQRVPLGWELPLRDMDGAELWELLSGTDPVVDAMIAGGLKNDEMFYPYDTGRFTPAKGIPNICHNTLPILTDDPDTLFDQLATRVPTWPRRPAPTQYRAFFALLGELLGRRVIVERSGSSLALISELRAEFPDARFVHMYRDGVDCALSMVRHPMFRLAALQYLLALEAGLPTSASFAEIAAVIPEQAAGLIVPPFDAERFMAYDIPAAIFARTWSIMVAGGIEALTALGPQSWTQLSYEELLAHPAAELTRLADFLGVPAEPDWLRSASDLIDPLRTGAATRIDAELRAELRAACGPGDRALASVAAAALRA